MALTNEKIRAYTEILKEELIPAMGCTEPIAISFASSIVKDVLGAYPTSLRVGLSGNIIKNVKSTKMGKKDIMKIDADIDINLDVLGYIDPDITINIVKNGEICEKRKLKLPRQLKNVVKCKNPRCITSAEGDLDQIFKLTDEENRTYRCIYCDSQIEK